MRKRAKHVSVWMNEVEYRHLREQAAIAGMGINPFMRSLIAGTQLRSRPPDQYAGLLRELSAIGNNINQIAHWANARGDIWESEVTDAIALVRRAWELVKNGL